MAKEDLKKRIEEYNDYLIEGKFTCFFCWETKNGKTSMALFLKTEEVDVYICQECAKLGTEAVYNKLNPIKTSS
jgi:transcription elongation factor Elf1